MKEKILRVVRKNIWHSFTEQRMDVHIQQRNAEKIAPHIKNILGALGTVKGQTRAVRPASACRKPL